MELSDLKSSVTVRKYSPSDREKCRTLWRELTEWHREIYGDPKIGGSKPEDKFDEHLATVGADNLWVAQVNSTVVGFVGLIVRGEEAEVEPIIVERQYRGKNVGNHLIETVISEARSRGLRLLTVKPVARNLQAIRFLHSHGFRNVGFIELFMDLADRSWKPGIEIFERQFSF